MAHRPLKGARYWRHDTAVPDLATVITQYLDRWDFEETVAFYNAFQALNPTESDMALLGLNDLYYLIVYLCRRRDALHPWLFDRAREVEREPDGCLDLWARGHYKSTFITFGKTIQDVLEDPELTVGIFSFSQATSGQFLGQIMQELERNDDLKACYPDVLYWNPAVESPRWSQKSGIILKREGNPKEGTIEAWGLVEGQPTSKHFGLLVFDDMIEQRNVTNAEQIKKATEAWELSDNLGIGDGTRKRYVGTRYLIGDTYETIINRKAAKVRLHPATHNGRIDGEPVFMSKATLDQKKIDQRSTFAAQMLQNPAAGKQAMFEAEWFRAYEVRPVTLNVYIMADPSMGRTKKSDRTAIAVIGVDAQGNKYLLDGARHRMKLSQRWEMLKRLYHKWKEANGVQILRVGYERYGQQSDMEYFEEQMRNSKDQADTFGIDELAWPNEGDNSKVARVGRLQPDFERSRFFLPPIVKHPDHGLCYWRYDDEEFKIVFRPWELGPHASDDERKDFKPGGYTRAQRAMQAQGMAYRIPKAITRYDEDGNIYDVTLALMEELTIFPFGAHDDLADATSRIYDMQPVPATQLDKIDPNLRVHHFDA